MTIDTFISKIDTLKNNLEAEGQRSTLISAVTGLSMIKERIQKKEGVGKYSDNEVATESFFAQNKGGREFKKKAKGSYKAFRKASGRQVQFVDLTFTGRMMNNIQIRGVKSTGQLKFETTAEPNQPEEEDKLRGHNKRYGKVLTLKPDEEETLQEDFNTRMVKFVKNALK